MKVEAVFVKSAAAASDFPADRLPEIGLVGRSNVGKSTLINALVRQRVARTSAAPGKTRLANIYRVTRGGDPLYLVDLPGYGYARGGAGAQREFARLTNAYFGRVGRVGDPPDLAVAALFLVDSRHPGLETDVEAWKWLRAVVDNDGAVIVGTKVDKLARGERILAFRALESLFEHPVLPVSAVTGEGLDELWKLIDKLAKKPHHNRPHSPNSSSPSRHRRPKATARPLLKN